MDLEQVGHRDSFDNQIREFWRKVKTLRMAERLQLLLEMTTVKVDNKRGRISMRDEFINKRHKRDSKCFTCGRKAQERHHVILIKNGGTNQGGNIVSLCLKCHNLLHPWMKDDRRPISYKPPLKHIYKKERLKRRTNNK